MKDTFIEIDSKREDPFNRVPQDVLALPAMTAKAKGIFSYLIGKPLHWRINVQDVVNHMADGEFAVRSAFLELRRLGFCTVDRTRNSLGEIEGCRWRLSDAPKWVDEPDNKLLQDKFLRKCSAMKRPKKFLRPRRGYPHRENRDTGNPHVANSDAENHHLRKKEGKKEGDSVRMSEAKLLRERPKSIRSAKEPNGHVVANDAPAALASVEALRDSLPKADSKALDEAYRSVPCVKFLRFWLTNFKLVHGRSCKFTEADVLAAQKLSSNSTVGAGAVIVAMWAAKIYTDPEVHNPFWACNHYSRSLADLVKINKGQEYDNFERCLRELNWRGLESQEERAWDWLEEVKNHRLGLPVEKP